MERSRRGFRRLIAWEKADQLAGAVFRSLRSSRVPAVLESQVLRAAISVPANIAEGCTRSSVADYLRFLDDVASETGKVLVGSMRSLKEKRADGSWNRIAEEGAEYVTDSEPLLPSFSFLHSGGEA